MKVLLDKGAFLPERAHKQDAGYDLRTPCTVFVPPHGDAIVDTGVHVEIPEGYVGFLKSKSGLNVKHGLTAEGVVDSGYTGSIVVKLYNHESESHVFERGDKIVQIVFLPIFTPDLEEVERLGVTERGENGFGSTGN